MFSQHDVSMFLKSGALMDAGSGNLLLGWGKSTWHETPYNHSFSYYFPDFFLHQKKPWLSFEHQETIRIAHLQNLLDDDKEGPSNLNWENENKTLFFDAISQLKKLFESKTLVKAVPYIVEKTSQKMKSRRLVASIKSALNYIQSNCGSIYGFWNPQEGILGVTPEILFSFEKSAEKWTVQSVALAGTAKNAINLQTSKNLHEHALVIEGIISALAPLGEITIGQIQALQFLHLAHLMTPIELSLKAPPPFR